jgi:hypothetical protein
MQLSPESVNVQSPSPNSGKHVWPNPTKMAGFRQNSSGSDQIRSDPGHFSQIQPDQWPNSVISGRIPPEVGSPASSCGGQMSPDFGAGSIPMAEFRCRLVLNDQLQSDSGNRISNMRARMKNIISENDLRFLKP